MQNGLHNLKVVIQFYQKSIKHSLKGETLMKIAMLTALLLSFFVHASANAEQELSLQVADAKEVLNDLSSVAKSKTDSYVFQNLEANNSNPADETWEGVTYIIDNKPSASQDEVPYFNYHFE